jgi:tetratricopeptide (TPR) repeat protein
VSAYLAQSYYTLGDQEAALAAARRALEIAEGLGDLPLKVAATAGLGQAHHALGDYAEAQVHLGRAIDALGGDLARERFGMAGLLSVAARVWLVNSLVAVADFDGAEARALEAVRLAESVDHPWSVAGAHVALGFVHLARGTLAAAVPVLERGLARARELDITAWLPMLSCQLGIVYARQGRVAEGVALLEEGIQRAASLSILSRHSLRHAWLAEAYLRAGRITEARVTAERALALARTHKERGYEGWALRMLGEVAARSGETPEAAAHFRAVLAVAAPRGMRALEAHAWAALGRLARAAGDHAEAERLDAAATARAAELGMVVAR